jgi:hypothetical protein
MECHGRVDQMPLTWRVAPMQMQWCLACHRDPAPHLHAPEEVFRMPSRPLQADDAAAAATLVRLEGTRRLTDCSTCHR